MTTERFLQNPFRKMTEYIHMNAHNRPDQKCVNNDVGHLFTSRYQEHFVPVYVFIDQSVNFQSEYVMFAHELISAHMNT